MSANLLVLKSNLYQELAYLIHIGSVCDTDSDSCTHLEIRPATLVDDFCVCDDAGGYRNFHVIPSQ